LLSRAAVALFAFLLSYDPVGAQHSGSDDNHTPAYCRYVWNIPEVDRECAAAKAKVHSRTEPRTAAEETCDAILTKSQVWKRALCIQIFEPRYAQMDFTLEPELQELCHRHGNRHSGSDEKIFSVFECLNVMHNREDRDYIKAKLEHRKTNKGAPFWCNYRSCEDY
jgi:hypothetical protein